MILDVIEKSVGTTTHPINLGYNVYAPFIYFAILTHAIEEYGKLLYIQSLRPDQQGIIEIEYEKARGSNSRGIFRDHNVKFALASSSLPPDVTVIHGGFGGNYGRNYGSATTTTWNARLEVLNTDIDLSGNPTNITSQIDLNRLRKSVFDFKNIVLVNNNVI